MALNFRRKYASLDTCILLRIIEKDNEVQCKQAMGLLLNGQEYFIDEVVISEFIYVLSKKHKSRAEIIDDLRCILSNSFLHYDKALLEPVFKTFLNKPSLSFNDCMIAAHVNKNKHLPLYTFDKKFANQSEVATLVE